MYASRSGDEEGKDLLLDVSVPSLNNNDGPVTNY